jgi:hypothetical protein
MTFESATTVLVTCLALGSLALVLAFVLLSMRAPEPQPVRAGAADRRQAGGGRAAHFQRDLDPGCNGIDR